MRSFASYHTYVRRNSAGITMMRVAVVTALLVLFACFAADCQKHYHGAPPDTSGQVTIPQGVWGNVWFWEGDFMPVVDGNTGTITPVQRKVYAYELTNRTQVEPPDSGGFFRILRTHPIDSVRSNSTGFFQMTLAPGRYSFFVREGSDYYAGSTDGLDNMLPATVVADSVSKVQIDIAYRSYD